MTLDEELVKAIDKAVKKLKTTRSAFAREALRRALSNLKSAELEQRHRRGYQMHPVTKKEFSVWENEQEWGDE
jgi:metal-responsive CopG/Arc/MetJ family transcriptional regulator